MTTYKKLSIEILHSKGRLDTAKMKLQDARSEMEKEESYYFGLRDALRLIENENSPEQSKAPDDTTQEKK